MSFSIAMLLNSSILVAGIIGLLRFKKINRIYYPFIFCIWLACINDFLSLYLVLNRHSPSINNNIYVGIEALLYTYFLVKTRLLQVSKHFFYFAAAGLVGLWTYENILLHKLVDVSTLFRIAYSTLLVLLSIMVINNLITSSRKHIFKNSIFLICIGFIIYYTFKIMVEAFWLYGLNLSTSFQTFIFDILIYINLLSNLIFALAVLWMPRKQVFTMPL